MGLGQRCATTCVCFPLALLRLRLLGQGRAMAQRWVLQLQVVLSEVVLLMLDLGLL